jgi:NADPH:quinone reductase-like Zn-dependent oxidoreductase
MRAAAIDNYGEEDAISVREVPVPRPSATEVLIRIDTAAVGSWDAGARSGEIKTEHEFPLVLGVDGSGVVAELGSRVTRFKRGDRVYAYNFDNPKGGFYAEYCCVAAKFVGRVPKELDLERAGALCVLGLTAIQGVDDALRVEKGDTVIVHGASGNVGMIAVQLAKWRGARVLATASGRDGVALVRALGIDDVVDGKRNDEISEAARAFAPDGADAVLAFVGGDSLVACIDALRKGGRVAYPNGIDPVPRTRAHIRLKPYDAKSSPEAFNRLSRAVVASRLQVPVAAKFPLEQAADAHRLIAKGHVLGKIILRMT